MQISDAFCFALLTITITASCAQAETRNQRQKHELTEENAGKQVAKRDASVIIEHYPFQPILKHRPKVIYRRISRQKYRSPKPKYGISRPKHRSSKPSRKVFNKYKKNISPKYGPPSRYKRPPKINYGYPKAPSYKPVYGPPKRSPHHYNAPEPVGFGEPPADYMLDYHFPKHTYGEPPEDSYGGHLQSATSDAFLTSHVFSDPIDLDNQDFAGQPFKSWKSYQVDDLDTNFVPSNKRPSYIKPEYESPTATEDDIISYSDIYKHEKQITKDVYNKNKTKQKLAGTTKLRNRPWTTPKNTVRRRPEAQVVVGGRYAEPPGRYFPKFHRSTPMSDDEDFDPPEEAVDPDVASSATISPYVNYKNSNVAFSPQNLNDAFSIVD